MTARDNARRRAQVTQQEDDWKAFRVIRNKCSDKCKEDRKAHFNKLYETHEQDKDVRSIYNLTKTQLGWKSGRPQAP